MVDNSETVVIDEKGLLTLDLGAPLQLKLVEGTHNIDSLSSELKARFKRHLELVKVLKDRNLYVCKFVYQKWFVPGTNRHYEADRIELIADTRTTLKQDQEWTIQWRNPDGKYKGNYLFIIRESFSNAFLDIIETSERELTINPSKYGHSHLLYHVKAEDCRASNTYGIRIKN